MRFLLSRRWITFFVVVTVLGCLAWELGQWQFRRLDERRQNNAIVERNVAEPAVPASELFDAERPATANTEWRVVTITGTYQSDDTVVVRYRTRDSAPGIEVVTPLMESNGTAVLVDRGWMQTDNAGSAKVDLPTPEPGKVTVTGYLRVNATGDSTQVDDMSTRAISSEQIAKQVDYPLAAGFVMLRSQAPAADVALGAPELPVIDDGPHFFYGLQWWFFGFLAVVGFLYLAYDEWRTSRVRRLQSAPLEDPGGQDSQRDDSA